MNARHSLAATLQQELRLRISCLSVMKSMGLVSAIREVADDESKTEFSADAQSYAILATRLQSMANETVDEMKEGYLEIAAIVKQHSRVLSASSSRSSV